jgi:membrane protease YdiL (CAAX protease family)
VETDTNKGYTDIWVFIISALFLSFLINWLNAVKQIPIPAYIALFAVGLLAFAFQLFAQRKPLIELYSKSHPYRKLKPYGVISTIILFEFILVWGLHTQQIVTTGKDLFFITIVFIGAIVYYHAFVRMKISLRFLFLAIFIPAIAAGAALGLGSYFNILQFVVPVKKIGDIVIFNTFYWVLFYIFIHMICEEPAFRGYLMQRLLVKGEAFAIIFSSLVFALWRLPFVLFSDMSWADMAITAGGNFMMGAMFALLFIKGRNLLVAVLCHGIIDGLGKSLFASSINPGIREYINFIIPQGEIQLMALWFGCLFIGLILLTIIPRKNINVR